MTATLTADERLSAMQKLTGWTYDEAAKVLQRSLKFKDFSAAFGFMTRVALAAQAANHHPDWSNAYNKVSITLSTHEAGGVTHKDIALAEAIDSLLT